MAEAARRGREGRRRGAGSDTVGQPAGFLILLGLSGELALAIGDVARFYGDGVVWAMGLPVDDLLRWQGVMHELRGRDHAGH
jgi:hypothetical protein